MEKFKRAKIWNQYEKNEISITKKFWLKDVYLTEINNMVDHLTCSDFLIVLMHVFIGVGILLGKVAINFQPKN